MHRKYRFILSSCFTVVISCFGLIACGTPENFYNVRSLSALGSGENSEQSLGPTNNSKRPSPSSLVSSVSQLQSNGNLLKQNGHRTLSVQGELSSLNEPAVPPDFAMAATAAAAEREPVFSVLADQCWAHLTVQPRRISSNQQFVLKDGRVAYEVNKALLKTKQHLLTVREGADSFRVEPPQYKRVFEQVKVREEVENFVSRPAVYIDEEELVMTESARVELRSCRSIGRHLLGSRSIPENKLQCAISIPAKYMTVTRSVLKSPETLVKEVIPAVYQTVEKWVLLENGKAVPVQIPSKQLQTSVIEVDVPSQAVPLTIPPSLKDLTLTTYVGHPQLTSRRVVCAKDSSASLIEALQAALVREGFDVGPIDQKLGRRTMRAIDAFQLKNGLANGSLTYETLNMLGIKGFD